MPTITLPPKIFGQRFVTNTPEHQIITEARLYGRVQRYERKTFDYLAKKLVEPHRIDALHIVCVNTSLRCYTHAIAQPRQGAPSSVITGCEGVVLSTPGTAAGVTARDCMLAAGVNMQTGATVAFHLGRDSFFTQPDCPGCMAGVVSNAIHTIAPSAADRTHVHVVAGGGIGATHFVHQPADYDKCVRPFAARFAQADGVVDEHRLTIDLRRALFLLLTRHLGVPAANIRIDPTCSVEDERLGSRRGEKPEQNVLIVVRPG